MITKLVSLALITALLHINAATASALEKFYPNELKEAKNVYSLAHDYFKGQHELKPGDTLDPDLLMDPKRQQALYKLNRLLALALDAGYDISDMAEFGLVIIPHGYVLDYRKAPQWASLNDLFSRIHSSGQLEQLTYHLVNQGFSQADIKVLEDYYRQRNPVELELLAEQSIIQKFSHGYQPDGLKKQSEIDHLIAYNEKVRKNRYDSRNLWAVKLLNKYSKQKRRILIDYLQHRLGMRAVAGFPMDEFELERQSQELANGSDLNVTQRKLAELRNQQKGSKQ